MGVFLWAPLVVSVVVAVGLAATRSSALARVAGALASVTVLVSGVLLVTAVLHGSIPSGGAGLLRADALSAYMLTVVGAVGLTATWGGMGTTSTGRGAEDAQAGTYGALVCLFLGAMSLAVLADNLGV